jgi:hypothetical protein
LVWGRQPCAGNSREGGRRDRETEIGVKHGSSRRLPGTNARDEGSRGGGELDMILGGLWPALFASVPNACHSAGSAADRFRLSLPHIDSCTAAWQGLDDPSRECVCIDPGVRPRRFPWLFRASREPAVDDSPFQQALLPVMGWTRTPGRRFQGVTGGPRSPGGLADMTGGARQRSEIATGSRCALIRTARPALCGIWTRAGPLAVRGAFMVRPVNR